MLPGGGGFYVWDGRIGGYTPVYGATNMGVVTGAMSGGAPPGPGALGGVAAGMPGHTPIITEGGGGVETGAGGGATGGMS